MQLRAVEAERGLGELGRNVVQMLRQKAAEQPLFPDEEYWDFKDEEPQEEATHTWKRIKELKDGWVRWWRFPKEEKTSGSTGSVKGSFGKTLFSPQIPKPSASKEERLSLAEESEARGKSLPRLKGEIVPKGESRPESGEELSPLERYLLNAAQQESFLLAVAASGILEYMTVTSAPDWGDNCLIYSIGEACGVKVTAEDISKVRAATEKTGFLSTAAVPTILNVLGIGGVRVVVIDPAGHASNWFAAEIFNPEATKTVYLVNAHNIHFGSATLRTGIHEEEANKKSQTGIRLVKEVKEAKEVKETKEEVKELPKSASLLLPGKTRSAQRRGALLVEHVLRERTDAKQYPEVRELFYRYIAELAKSRQVSIDLILAGLDPSQIKELLFKAQQWKSPKPQLPLAVPEQTEKTASTLEAPITETELLEFGFYIDEKNPGAIWDGFAFEPIQAGRKRGGEPRDVPGFVGSVATTPARSPLDIAEMYRAQAFAFPELADHDFQLAIVVNSRMWLDPEKNPAHAVATTMDTIRKWRPSRFPVIVGGFLWHPWLTSKGEPADLFKVRDRLDQLPLLAKKILLYERSKRTSATMVPYGLARHRAFVLANLLAKAVAPLYSSVLIHLCDADTPSFRSRRPQGPQPPLVDKPQLPSERTHVRLPAKRGSRDELDVESRKTGLGLEEAEKAGLRSPVRESLLPVFEQYRELIAQLGPEKRKLPFILSGGYELRLAPEGDIGDNDTLTLLGHRLDLVIRDTVAKSLGGSGGNIYLPEPNLLFKWHSKLLEVDALLPEAKQSLFGSGNKESVRLVSNYRLRLAVGNGVVVTIIYDLSANIPTETPERFRISPDEPKEPYARSRVKASRLSRNELRQICEQSQCYANFDTWSIAVGENLAVPVTELRPAFNACMITEHFGFDPKAIFEHLDSFVMPSAIELHVYLTEVALAKFTNLTIRDERAKLLIDLLLRTGRATIGFMHRLRLGSVPDATVRSFNDEVEHYVKAELAAYESWLERNRREAALKEEKELKRKQEMTPDGRYRELISLGKIDQAYSLAMKESVGPETLKDLAPRLIKLPKFLAGFLAKLAKGNPALLADILLENLATLSTLNNRKKLLAGPVQIVCVWLEQNGKSETAGQLKKLID